MKNDSSENISVANQRITNDFYELLEQQFPVDNFHSPIKYRKPNDFANLLHIHVNHLNRVLKISKNKTTSQIITERLLKEAKLLLTERNWNISEIAHALGFKEANHFSVFFRNRLKQSPQQYRKCLNIVVYCLMDVVI